MRSLGFLAALLAGSALQGPPLPAQEADTAAALARRWVERLTTVMRENATRQDLDDLLTLYMDDAVYEHPRGKRKIRREMAEFLGETRSPNLRTKSALEGRTSSSWSSGLDPGHGPGNRRLPHPARRVDYW